MGRKSVRENKSRYQELRENADLTREQAAEQLEFISDARLYKIESGLSVVQPDEVKKMAEVYRAPALCNYYCTHECVLGMDRVPEAENKTLMQIAVETLNALNRLDKEKARLLEIVEDGIIDMDEYEDFNKIRGLLKRVASSVSNLDLWLEEMVSNGKLDKERLKD